MPLPEEVVFRIYNFNIYFIMLNLFSVIKLKKSKLFENYFLPSAHESLSCTYYLIKIKIDTLCLETAIEI